MKMGKRKRKRLRLERERNWRRTVVGITKTGRKLTNARIEELALEAERGYDVSKITAITRERRA